ncbi:puromycin-sensitive aminopeptidase-like protein [Trypanosoma grayi]|uniref:puromycin-sensitive aminopeptidase-like protein n=1 Tax=Trypanosoma grayi TaxID=71804 RepID=UPI0004F4A983|nr:puromycin-sensitive aminopeptidase-like protein [Trypanosoma grayi]KEG08542.1 puromycin-sensitive aminopeptidase-like protein [Trypanosoma grayi]
MFVNAVFPNWLIWDEFLTQILDDVLVLDAQPDKTHPVQYCNSKPRCIDGSFDTISYGKGASILRMLFSLLGRDRLQKAAHCLLQRSSSRVLDDKVFLDCICDKECAPAEYEDVAAVLRYTERSGHPLLYVEHLESACRVTQYESPDLRQGILPAYVKAQQQQRCDGRSPVDLMTPRYTRSFAWDPEKFLKRSDYMVPVSIMEVRPGVSSFARPYYMRASRETITGAPGQLIYFNYRGTGVLRCDYDTATWLRIFEISPFLSSEDRTVITMTLFRFRSMHIGHDSSEPSDRCTLLLEWLLLLSQRSFTNASQWKYITEHMERMAYIVRDYPCWGIFSQFVCTIYAPLVQRGVVSFAVQEKTVSFASQTNLSRQTVLHILQVLAICRSSMIIDESRQLVDWALASVLPNLAMSSSAAAYRAVTFDISDDVDTTAASIAMQCLTEHGDMKAWWTLACVLARLLGHPLRRAAVELRCEEVDVHFSHLGEKGERRWINMVAPAVFALDSSSALPFLVGVLQHFTRLNTPIAKAILRNKRLITWLFEAPEAGEMIPRLGVIRRLLVMHVAAFCSDSNLIALMKSFVAALPEANSNNVVDAVPGPAAGHPNLLVNAVAAMETNYVWIDYCCDHYLAFLSMKQSSHAWVSMHAASPGSNADIYAMDRDGVSI